MFLESFIEFFGDDIDSLKDVSYATWHIINRCLALPKPDLQKHILMWAILTPTSYAVTLPRLFSFGVTSGTGKSTSGKILSKIRGFPILQSGATGASIRNTLMALKYGKQWKKMIDEGEKLGMEQHCGLICDDINPDQIRMDQVRLSILKSGIDRSCSLVTIANPGTGENIEFDVFGLIAFSSCFPLWAYPDLFELKRRILIIKMMNFDSLTEEEKQENTHPDDLENLDYFDFRDFRLYDEFYTEERLKEFLKIQRSKKLKNQLKDSQLSSDQGFLLTSIIANAILLGNDMAAVIDYFERYYHEIYLDNISDKNSLEQWLEDYVKEQEKFSFPPYELNSKHLKEKLDDAFELGYIMERNDPKVISSIMYRLGYRQQLSTINPYSRLPIWRKFA